ncbi:hypothetical protein, partial [Lactococcus garvieae]|uniref:hypothetical protein n=1 Tax=Lactococcus garvieae TaxID=1363 RepID=UPI003D6F4D76
KKSSLKLSWNFSLSDNYYFQRKCSQICSHSKDLYCYTLKLKISRIALKSIFEHQLMSNEYLFNFFNNTRIIPNDPSWKVLWGLEKISMPQAWDMNTGSAEVKVAVIDILMKIY